MAMNPAGTQQLPWTLFGGLNTELEAPTMPEGLSPDCQDVAFLPGDVYTRPALTSLFATGFGDVGVTYNKTFIQPNGDPLNLVLTSDGVMHQQDVRNSPTVPTSIFNVIPGIYASSVTAFGREYMAFHDGAVAKDIPRQYDGTIVRRISQEGPACSGDQLTAADAGTTTIPIATIVPKAQVSIATITLGTGIGTVVTTTPHGLIVGDRGLISGNSTYQYNGQVTVASVPNPTSFVFDTLASALPNGTGGIIIPDTVTVTTTGAHGLISGETITIAGNSDNNYNNSQGATSLSVGLATNPVCTFYNYVDHNGGNFNYTFPGDGFNEPLPGPIGSFTFPADASILMNPNGPTMGTNLTGAPSYSNPPMIAMGIDSKGAYNGHQYTISSSLLFDWVMVVNFQIAVSAAGNVTFQIVHKEGVRLGVGGGATYVSGPINEPQGATKTAQHGYADCYANNGSTEFFSVSVFNAQFTVNFPAPGIYPVEINYCQWHHSDPGLVLKWQNSVPTFVPLQPGGVAFATPSTWTVGDILNSTKFKFDAVYAQGSGTGGTITVGGLIAPGPHQLCVSFMTDTDYITKPCPPVSWTAAGNKRVVVDGLPIGPPNTKARVVSFTGTGGTAQSAGGNFFYIPIPAVDPLTGQTVSTSTVINDNTSTTATFDFADNTLFEGIGIDITGNNLFGLVTLGPTANVFTYSNRLFAWGDTNKIQNLFNMTFAGGTATVGGTSPLGWTVGAGGTLVAGEFDYGWEISGNGTNTAMGMLSQPAFQDYLKVPILLPLTQYTFELFAYANVANAQGNIVAELFSPTSGSLISATIAAKTLGVTSTNGRFVQADFVGKTPAVIPEDTELRIYAQNLGNEQTVTLDEMMMVYTASPTVPGQTRVSYSINPESFDGVTGIYDLQYSEPVQSMQIIRDNLYTLSSKHLCRTQDNGVGEPVTWANYTVSDKAGGLSLRCFDTSEGWGIFASEQGLMMFSGGPVQKVSQEIQTLWSDIDPLLVKDVWIRIDPVAKRMYVGAPLTAYQPTGTTFTPASCNKLLVMDFRELNTASAVESAMPLHISMSGKMLSSDLSRKWTVWNLPMNCGEIISMPEQEPSMAFGSGDGAGLAGGFGNVYTLDEELLSASDADYGVIGNLNGESPVYDKKTGLLKSGRPNNAYIVTFFAPSHDQEQQQQIGSQRKLYTYLEAYVTGIGNFFVVPLLDRLGNTSSRPPKSRQLVSALNYDLEWPLNHRAQRLAFLFYALPLGTPLRITINPTGVSVAKNATQQFTYTLSGTRTTDVNWSCSGGTITPSGLYTAPNTASTFIVTVTSVDMPSVSASATVVVTGGSGG